MACESDAAAERLEYLEDAEARLQELERMFDQLDRLLMSAERYQAPWETISAAKWILERFRKPGNRD